MIIFQARIALALFLAIINGLAKWFQWKPIFFVQMLENAHSRG
jgi:hypothetical protein